MFKIGDLVKFRSGYRSNLPCEYAVGEIIDIIEHLGHSFVVRWRGFGDEIRYTKDHIDSKQWWEKVEDPLLKVLEKPKDSFPELLTASKSNGYLEEYVAINKQKKVYWYTRYVYQQNSGKLKHHHVPKKQKEPIEALWRSGATAKQICIALGKSSEQTTLDPCRILTDVPL